MNLTNNVYTAVYGALSAGEATSGLTITRDEYPSGVSPAETGDIHIGIRGGKIVRLMGSELQDYEITIGVATRGNSTFDTASELQSGIRTTLESGFSVSGGTFIYCLARELPRQEDSTPIDRVFAKYFLEVQVT